MAHRALEAAAHADFLDRRPFRAEPVGVGLLLGAVVGVPVAGADAQQVRHRHPLEQRHAHFAENLAHVEGAAHADGRPTLACEVEGRELGVGFQDESFLAVLQPEDDAQAVLGGGYLDPVAAEVGRHRPPENLLRRVTVLEPGRLQIVERRLSHPAQAPDVVRHAVRVEAAHERPAGRQPGGRIGDDVHGPQNTRFRKIVPVYALVQHASLLIEGVVVPDLGQIALDAEHAAVRRMAYVVLTPAAFDIAPADQHVGGISGCRKGSSPIVGRDRVLPGPRPSAEQRVLEMDGVRPKEVGAAEEDAAGGDLRHRMVVVHLEFPVRTHFRGDVHVHERGERPLLRRPAVVVVRTEVELVGGGAETPRIAGCVGDREARAVAAHEKAAGKGGRGTAAGKAVPGVERAGAEIAARLQDRVLLLVVEEQRRVALVAGEVASHQETEVPDGAVGPDVVRHVELGGVGRRAPVHDVGDPIGVLLLVIVEAAVGVDLQALEAVVHDEVPDARDRIGAVHRRCAAGQELHALDQRRRDLVEVGRIGIGSGARAARGQAAPVDEHEVAGRAEVAQIHVRRPGGAVRTHAPLAGIDLGQLIEQILGLGVAVELDVLRVQRGDRAGALHVHLRDARAGDFDSLDLLGGSRPCRLRGLSDLCGLCGLSGLCGLRGLSGLLRRLLRVSDLRSYHRERDFRRDNGRFLRKNCPRAFVVAHYGFSPSYLAKWQSLDSPTGGL